MGRSTHHVELAGKERRAAVLRLALVRRVVLEELALILESSRNRLLGIDVTLATVDHWYVTQTQRNHSSSEDVHDIRSSVPISR